jgi:hypothetical protein
MDVKTDLMRDEAWGPLAIGAVELVETHVSRVFLRGAEVIKVKKPVSLGFLDFRTLEQRKAACEAEVRLNARLAPHVYRGVVPIRLGGDGRARLGGDGPIVDWAVHMARLPDERRADVLLARGELSADMIDAVARRIAAFHAAIPSDDHATRFGAPEVIRGNVEENFAQTRGSIRRYLDASEAEEIVRWQTSFVRDHEDLLLERMKKGRVRDGHGDLRLEHVYFEEGRAPTILDCIEFNERFRFADVCADVAFLSMDLAGHGRVDLAEQLLARYARASNDYDLYALVDFYESYRAFVRGKIASVTAADEGVPAAARARAEDDARRYFLLALSADRRSLLAPAVVAVGGILASGKSTVAERIAAETSAPVVDADRTRKGMLGVAHEQPVHTGAWRGAYDPRFTEDVYAEVLRRAGVVLASGRPVVIDASFRSRATRAAARALAVEHGVPFRFVECRASPDVCRARLARREREPGVSDGRLAIFDAFVSKFEPVTEIDAQEHVVLDTTRPWEESAARLHERLDTWPPGLTA